MAEQLGVAAGLVRLSFLVQSLYGEVCEAHDLTPLQAQLLCVLSDAPPRGMAELAHTLRLDKSSVTVELTPAGSTLADTFHEAATERLNETVASLPERDRTRLAAIASNVVDSEQVPAVSPLITDLVVVTVVLRTLDRLPTHPLGLLGVIGGLFVIFVGVQTILESRDARLPTGGTKPTPACSTLGRASVMNLTSPHPWITWATALGPRWPPTTVVRAGQWPWWSGSTPPWSGRRWSWR